MRAILLTLATVSLLSASLIRDNTLEVVYDNQADLTWQDNKSTSAIRKNWSNAINYCEALNFAGFQDWRLPNVNELFSITDFSRVMPTIKKEFKNIVNRAYASDEIYGGYWSSTSLDSSDARVVIFKENFLTDAIDNKSASNNIRCVRNGKIAKHSTLKPTVTYADNDYYWSIVTMKGYGFGKGINAMATVNGQPCKITSWNNTKIVAEECPIRGCDTFVATTDDGSFSKILDCGNASISTKPGLNPKVTYSNNDYYWKIITMKGSGFGKGTNSKVTVNGNVCKVTSWSDTKIVAEECPIRGCDTFVATTKEGSFIKLLDCN